MHNTYGISRTTVLIGWSSEWVDINITTHLYASQFNSAQLFCLHFKRGVAVRLG